ncbi:MAG: thioredoxin [Deltaproteobacteria bacterium]|nr:thioredoxin [Deltaproteobacteria bacterium]
MAIGNIVAITDESFEKEVKTATGVVLVDFWAPWCGPCRSLGPILEDVATHYGEKIKVGKINVDENAKIAADFSVASIPTMVFFKDGKATETLIGLASKEKLLKIIDKLLQG